MPWMGPQAGDHAAPGGRAVSGYRPEVAVDCFAMPLRRRRELRTQLDRLEDELGRLSEQLAQKAPVSDVDRLNLAFEQLAKKAPVSEVDRLNLAFEDLAKKAPISEVDRLNRAFEQLAELRTEVDLKLGWRPFFSNYAFEDSFRGTADQLREQYRDLARELIDCSPVVDLGCGRGEFLELLGELGVAARGIEIDAELVGHGRKRGLEIVEADAVSYLRARDNHSLGALVLLQVIEHLSPQQAVDLVSLAADKLRPGGKLILETVNPQSLFVYTNAFYIDPTHTQPVHPFYIMFLLREAGFGSAEIRWRSPVPEGTQLPHVTGEPTSLSDQLNERIDQLNTFLYGPQDYAVVAIR